MRHRPAVRSAAAVLTGLAALVAPAGLGGCSGGGGMPVKVSGPFGTRPEVTIPKDGPGDDLAVKSLTKGRGPRIAAGDLVVADYVSYRWQGSTSKLIASSYVAGQPSAFPSGEMVPGLEKALRGRRAGGRVVAVIPPRDGYGAGGAPQKQVEPGDSLVYVLDVRAVYPRSAVASGRPQPPPGAALPQVTAPAAGRPPQVTVPRAGPPERLTVRTLVQGQGPPVRRGQLLALQQMGLLWRDGKIFDSSWSAGRPYAAVIGVRQLVRGWDEGLVGQRAGGRVMLVIPPAWAYGGKGLKRYGIRGDDTLVFVVDVLGAH